MAGAEHLTPPGFSTSTPTLVALLHWHKAWVEGASHLLFFSRSPFSWAHESLCDIFKDLPGAWDQRLSTFLACELMPAFS